MMNQRVKVPAPLPAHPWVEKYGHIVTFIRVNEPNIIIDVENPLHCLTNHVIYYVQYFVLLGKPWQCIGFSHSL